MRRDLRRRRRGQAEWKPTKPVEFVVTSGAGGGTDNFARTIQSIIAKNNLMEAPVVVVNKGGGSGAEGYRLRRRASGDPNKLDLRHQQRVSAALRRQARLQARRPDAGRGAWRSTSS